MRTLFTSFIMGAGASSQSAPAAPADLLTALDELNQQAQKVPIAEQTSVQLLKLAERLGSLQAAATALAQSKAAGQRN